MRKAMFGLTLDKEIRTLELYLEIEQMRFSNAFEFEFMVDEELDAYTVEIPAMIIQPFIENAIWHGLMPLKEAGRVTIEFKKEKHYLVIIINDNGKGFLLTNLSNEGNSSGIRLVRQRLDLLSQYFNTSVKLDIDSSPSKGTLVTIKIPSELSIE